MIRKTVTTDELLDAMPPNDPEAETWVLGSILLRPEALDEVEFLSLEDFYDPKRRAIFAAMRGASKRGEPIDPGLVRKTLDGSGWAELVADLVANVPVSYHAEHYARIVSRLGKNRRLKEVAIELLKQAQAAGDPETIGADAEKAIADIRAGTDGVKSVTMRQAAMEAAKWLQSVEERGYQIGTPTGLYSFDADNGGLFPGELTILAARPGLGKTSLACQVARHNGQQGRLVYIISLEMSAAELHLKMACTVSGVSSRLVRTGRISDAEREKLVCAMNELAEVAIEICDQGAVKVGDIRREVRRRVDRGLSLVVIDYLQLVTPDDVKIPREQQVARITRELKGVAREFKVPVLCLCQLNRQADGDEQPKLSHLRESGAIEQDADMVLFIAPHKPTDIAPNNASLIVAKHRNGEVGPLAVNWIASETRFECPDAPMPFDEFRQWDGTQRDMFS